jgi:hypothetical protein
MSFVVQATHNMIRIGVRMIYYSSSMLVLLDSSHANLSMLVLLDSSHANLFELDPVLSLLCSVV